MSEGQGAAESWAADGHLLSTVRAPLLPPGAMAAASVIWVGFSAATTHPHPFPDLLMGLDPSEGWQNGSHTSAGESRRGHVKVKGHVPSQSGAWCGLNL